MGKPSNGTQKGPGQRKGKSLHSQACVSLTPSRLHLGELQEGRTEPPSPARAGCGLRAAGQAALRWGTACRNHGPQGGKGFASLTKTGGEPEAKGQRRLGNAGKPCGGGDLRQTDRQTCTLSFLGVQGAGKGRRTTVFKDEPQSVGEAVGQVCALPSLCTLQYWRPHGVGGRGPGGVWLEGLRFGQATPSGLFPPSQTAAPSLWFVL